MMARGRRRAEALALICASGLAAWTGRPLEAATIRVPRDHPTIKSAVYAAAAGDTVLIDNGIYPETNIIVDKPVTIKAAFLFGPSIYGRLRAEEAIFVIRAAARLEGLTLVGASVGICQRGSPDVAWEAENIVFFGCRTALSVNDPETNIGRASVRGVAVFGGYRRPANEGGRTVARDVEYGEGISTNDAGGVDVERSLFIGCESAFIGYDHLFFRVRESVIAGDGMAVDEKTGWRPLPPATSRVDLDPGAAVLPAAQLKDPARRRRVGAFIRSSMFREAVRTSPGRPEAVRALEGLADGELALAAGDHRGAASGFRRALEAANLAALPEFAWRARSGLAAALRAAGSLDEAIETCRAAARDVEARQAGIPQGIFRANYLDDKLVVYEELIGLLLDRRRDRAWLEVDAEAFHWAERAKSLSTFLPPRPLTPEGPFEKARLGSVKAIAALQLELQDPDLPRARKEALLASLERAEEDYHAALIGGLSAARGATTAPPPLRYADMRPLLGGGRAVLSYFLGVRESYAFLATEKALVSARLPPAAVIEAMVEPYLRFLQLNDTRDFQGATGGRKLFALLLGQFPREVRKALRRVVICPGGKLNYLPFDALVDTDMDGGEGRPRYWGESVETSYAPSASFALSDAGRRGGPGARILAVGYSDGPRFDDRSRDARNVFQALGHVTAEVKAIAARFPRGSVTTLVGREAAERRLKQAGLENFDIIHMATHGLIDDGAWWRSALLLGEDERAPEDGLLTALEVGELSLKARLVTLSACRTGLGGVSSGEGIRGLAGAFLQAGADRLLVSLWSVEDKATAAFMGGFYKHLSAGAPPESALREAKLEMLRKRYAHPFYWAAFVLVGRSEAAR